MQPGRGRVSGPRLRIHRCGRNGKAHSHPTLPRSRGRAGGGCKQWAHRDQVFETYSTGNFPISDSGPLLAFPASGGRGELDRAYRRNDDIPRRLAVVSWTKSRNPSAAKKREPETTVPQPLSGFVHAAINRQSRSSARNSICCNRGRFSSQMDLPVV